MEAVGFVILLFLILGLNDAVNKLHKRVKQLEAGDDDEDEDNTCF